MSLRLGDTAPDFEQDSSEGRINFHQWLGNSWGILFSHPADFTPVCTSEFVAFQNAMPEFEKLNCNLLGLAIDSLYAHIAWIKDIEARFDVKITFPIIEDISMEVARAYGMIHDASATTAAVRSVFFIDPEGYVRALIHYPMNVGRSVKEIIRVLSALQLTDANQVTTPEGWTPGEKTMLPPPMDLAEADQRSSQDGAPWYYCYKDER